MSLGAPCISVPLAQHPSRTRTAVALPFPPRYAITVRRRRKKGMPSSDSRPIRARRPPPAVDRNSACNILLDMAVKVILPCEYASPAPATPVVAAALRLERLRVRQRLGLVPLEVLPCRQGFRAAGQGARVSGPFARPATTSVRRSVFPDAAQPTVYGCIMSALASIQAMEPCMATC